MIKVNNKKAIANLAAKSFRANKTRNIIAVIAIALTTILFTSMFTMGIGTVESLQKATMRQAGGDGHAVLKYLTQEQFDAAKDNAAIKEIAFDMALCDSVDNDALLKRHAEFWYYDAVGLKLTFIEPEAGHIPQAENEVIVDSKTLELLDVPQELGATVSLELNIRGELVTRDFVLCGWWESDPAFNVGQIFASRAYVDAHPDELRCTYYDDYSMTGAINAYIMFPNSMNLEAKLNQVLSESGFSPIETDANYVASNVNWSYLSTNFGMDAGTLIGLGCGLLLIVFTGYLIIYNIFQISIVRDIRFYGLLKTIGTTATQLRRIIRRQALILSSIGIPIGLFFGFFSGRALVPLLMNNSSYAGSAVSVSPNPLIFIGSALFALVTVFISTLKPGRMAGRVSPIEAVRYTETDVPRSGQKKSVNGAKMGRMALSNVGRNKKRTILVVISLSLSIVLLNAVVTLSGSIDMDKFISKFSDTDFLIAHADYFNNDFFGKEDELSEQMISAVQSLDGFEAGGRLYGGRENMFFAENSGDTASVNRDDRGYPFSAVYGLESLPMERLDLIDGEIDMEKLMGGDCILEGVQLDDNGRVEMDTAHYQVGDTVVLHNWRNDPSNPEKKIDVPHTYTVLGHVAIKTYTNCDRSYWGYTFYLPAEVYKTLVDTPAVMSYAFNIEDSQEAAAESFLKTYTDGVEPTMNYESKSTTADAFSGMRNTVLLVGGALGGIISLIGILNFINAVLTSIVARKKELAMLQSIGMTRRQLKKMLCCEGLCYAGLSGLCALVLGIVLSMVIVRAICSQLWFLSYHMVIWPLLIALPILLILGVTVPLVVHHAADRQSIVERLREAE
ncbi:FtsX-like permease family protein [Butyricicoccus sp. Marseille-Q5471]|uniref:FtsX-like permease family protein n=1 Tax=Butyricicoccus sp. Marseille-Q5471 TaxID=3039493 RepID=UPI0024BC3F8B|nr:ABC transporter permease [Butyricicoccus sp. Marseille-Q5471]